MVPGHPLLPPAYQAMTGLADLGEVPALPRSVSTRCPVSWARRFPLRFARSPPFAALRRCGPRSVTMGHSHVHQPVGYSVAFLRWPSRSRFSAGWVTSPRIVIPPLISLSGQKLGRMVEYARLMVRSASVNGRPRTTPEARGRGCAIAAVPAARSGFRRGRILHGPDRHQAGSCPNGAR